MAETAAHLVDHVFPRAPVRQWVLSLPKRLRPYLHYDPTLAGAVLRIFLSEIERSLQTNVTGGWPTIRDQYDRDIAIAKGKYPFLKGKDIKKQIMKYE